MRKDLLSMQKALKQLKNPNFPEYQAEASTTAVNLNIPDPSKQIVNTNLGPAKGANAKLRLSEKVKNISDDKRPGGEKPSTSESIKEYINYFFS